MKNACRISVLLVDDSPDFRGLVADSLTDAGFIVTEASGGNEAFEMLKVHEFDAVVTDVQMPSGDGICLLKSIRTLSPSTPVILMTGNPFLQLQLEKDRNLTALFLKPFVHSELVTLVKQLCFEGRLSIAL